jgi:hypothetical protein
MPYRGQEWLLCGFPGVLPFGMVYPSQEQSLSLSFFFLVNQLLKPGRKYQLSLELGNGLSF